MEKESFVFCSWAMHLAMEGILYIRKSAFFIVTNGYDFENNMNKAVYLWFKWKWIYAHLFKLHTHSFWVW